jgi:Zn-finger nucleic acid-binding protein
MNCVACKEPMIVLELEQVEIDYCLDCGGVWLDAGELELLLEKPGEVEVFLAKPAAAGQVTPGNRKCPICDKKMEIIAIGNNQPVHIDRCPQGHGLWFDRGELKDIIEIMGGLADSRVADLLRDIFGEKKKQS